MTDRLRIDRDPLQPEGLEVVGTLRYFMDYPDSPNNAPGYITHQFNPASWDHAGEAVGEHPLCRLSDAQRAIAELREECKIQRNSLAGARNQLRANRLETERLAVDWQAAVAERDTLRQKIAERDAAIEEWSGTAVQNGMECDRLAAQRDRLAVALDGIKSDLSAAMNWGDLVRIAVRIDAALAEVSK